MIEKGKKSALIFLFFKKKKNKNKNYTGILQNNGEKEQGVGPGVGLQSNKVLNSKSFRAHG